MILMEHQKGDPPPLVLPSMTSLASLILEAKKWLPPASGWFATITFLCASFTFSAGTFSLCVFQSQTHTHIFETMYIFLNETIVNAIKLITQKPSPDAKNESSFSFGHGRLETAFVEFLDFGPRWPSLECLPSLDTISTSKCSRSYSNSRQKWCRLMLPTHITKSSI